MIVVLGYASPFAVYDIARMDDTVMSSYFKSMKLCKVNSNSCVCDCGTPWTFQLTTLRELLPFRKMYEGG